MLKKMNITSTRVVIFLAVVAIVLVLLFESRTAISHSTQEESGGVSKIVTMKDGEVVISGFKDVEIPANTVIPDIILNDGTIIPSFILPQRLTIVGARLVSADEVNVDGDIGQVIAEEAYEETPVAEEVTEFVEEVLVEETSSGLDRSQPLYKVYKRGYPVEVSAELQWYIHDMCEKYGYIEKYIYGMILQESCFQADCVIGIWKGLCQIESYWITKANITHFTDDYSSRNLLDPYDNLLTMCEMFEYAKSIYNLDLTTDLGMTKVLYWHATGKNPSNISSYAYATRCLEMGNELVPLQ